ncbi:MAG TPA: FtsQ-type POTRA domain-containing protein [Arsenicitalea sp.]|nr:FtsQ-type POTRA domain-containing protein [Arsenicitalea sp.]
MQQVGSKAMTATAIALDGHRLPVAPRNPGRRALINAGYVWVLHKRVLLRALAAALCCVAIVGVYEMRGKIQDGVITAGDLAQNKFADVGFAVGEISISGQSITHEADIVKALAIEPHMSTVDFDADAARQRIEKLPAIASATVRKIYPGHVIVSVTEKVPVARWRVDGATFVVDKDGEQIGDDGAAYSELPLVIGDGAADDAQAMIHALSRFDDLKKGLAALSRIGDRRWDMIYDTGLRVQLPETGVVQALNQLETFEKNYQLLERDVTLIDLRVPTIMALLPSKDVIAQLALLNKKTPVRHGKGDAEYGTAN